MTRSMFLVYFSISLAVISSALYHFSARSVPANVNFAVSLVVTYGVALGVTVLAALILPREDRMLTEFQRVNWSSVLLGVAVVGIEFGFLLCYRAGWNLGIAAPLATVLASLLLVPLAILIFKENLNWINVGGILVCLAGLLMLNWNR